MLLNTWILLRGSYAPLQRDYGKEA